MLADRKIGEVEEDHGRPLGVGESSQSREEVGIAVLVQVFIDRAGYETVHTPGLQGAGGDPEGRTPDPRRRITDRRTAVQELRECLRDGVAGDVGVTCEGVDGAPESFGVGPIHGFDALARFRYGHCAVHQ